ncbi:MAG: hypothetical protein WCH44_11570, partial [Betaproteobacteria bacterium]
MCFKTARSGCSAMAALGIQVGAQIPQPLDGFFSHFQGVGYFNTQVGYGGLDAIDLSRRMAEFLHERLQRT